MREVGRRKIDCIVYSCVFRTPPIISLFGVLYCDNGLLSSTSGKLRGMNAPLRSPGSVDLLPPFPDPSGSLMRRRLREKIGGNRRDTQHRPGFSPSRVRLFRFLKGFRGFFNELILPIENIDQRETRFFFSLFSLFYLISNKNSKIDLRNNPKFIQRKKK